MMYIMFVNFLETLIPFLFYQLHNDIFSQPKMLNYLNVFSVVLLEMVAPTQNHLYS